MIKNNLNFNQGSFLLFDSKSMPKHLDTPLAHFALTDALISYSGRNNQSIIHFWQTSPLVILGMMDTKIGHFEKALDIFKDSQYDYIIRNSGGLAIVSDPGVLNISLIYPSPADERISIDEAYERMLNFVRQTFYPYFPQKTIEAFEVKHSYCFGDYDLSIDGKKIAGISQRRIQEGVAVMIYISINGLQKERAELLKEFYDIGLDGTEPDGRYPNIKPEVMASLEDIYETKLTVEKVKEKMLAHFDWTDGKYSPHLMTAFDESLNKMYKRNKKFLGENYVKNNLN